MKALPNILTGSRLVLTLVLLLFLAGAADALPFVRVDESLRLQLIALALLLFVPAWPFWGLPCDPDVQAKAGGWALGLLWLAAAVTVWTGAEYALSARRALRT